MFLDSQDANPSFRALAAESESAGSLPSLLFLFESEGNVEEPDRRAAQSYPLPIIAVNTEGCPARDKKAQGSNWKPAPLLPSLHWRS